MINFKKIKKMNLNNLNLAELNAQEVQNIDGGDRSPLTIGVEIGVGICFGLVGIVVFEVAYNLNR